MARGGTLPRPWPAPEVVEISPGFGFEGEGWSLASCSVPHAQPFLACMAFSVVSEGIKFVYSGDAGLADDLEALAKDADLLLHWCYRLSDETDVSQFMREAAPTPPEIAAMAERVGVRRLVLTHFRVGMDEPERHAKALEELDKVFCGPSRIAEDLDTYTIAADSFRSRP